MTVVLAWDIMKHQIRVLLVLKTAKIVTQANVFAVLRDIILILKVQHVYIALIIVHYVKKVGVVIVMLDMF